MTDITAARYNILQARIAEVLGNGAGNSGYGQPLQSFQVNATGAPSSTDPVEDLALKRIIDNDHMNRLYQDMISARIHQTGFPIPDDILPITEGDLVELTSQTGQTGIVQYENFMNTIVEEKLTADFATQTVTEFAGDISNLRSTPWNGSIVHEFRATFTSADARRHFFNAGGNILISLNLSGGTGQKTDSWRDLVSDVGTIGFDYEKTYSTNSTPTYDTVINSIGNYDLSDTYQTIYRKTIIDSLNDYNSNSIEIKAKEPSEGLIDFRIVLSDTADLINDIDENVSGVVSSTVQIIRADGVGLELELANSDKLNISAVETPAPAFSNIATLSAGGDVVALPETYSLEANRTIVNEGQTVTVTLNTGNVADGTRVPYTITGVTLADLNEPASLTGEFVVSNNRDSFVIQLRTDDVVNEEEQLTIQLDNGQATVIIDINDISLGAASYALTTNKQNNEFEEGENVQITLTYSNNTLYDNLPLFFGLTDVPDTDFRFGTGDDEFRNLVKNSPGPFTSTITKTIARDRTTEAQIESKTVYLNSRSNPLATLTFNIRDTSQNVESQYTLTAESDRIETGQNITLRLSTANIDQGQTVQYVITGDLSVLSNPSALTGTFVIGANGLATDTVATTDTVSDGNYNLVFALLNIPQTDSTRQAVTVFKVADEDPIITRPGCENPPDINTVEALLSVDNYILYNDGSISGPLNLVKDEDGSPYTAEGQEIYNWYITELGRPPDSYTSGLLRGFEFWLNDYRTLGSTQAFANFQNATAPELAKGGVSRVLTFCEFQALEPTLNAPDPSEPTDTPVLSNVKITPDPIFVLPDRQFYLDGLPASIRNNFFSGFQGTVKETATLSYSLAGGYATEVQGDKISTTRRGKSLDSIQAFSNTFQVDYTDITASRGDVVEGTLNHKISGYGIASNGSETVTQQNIDTPVRFKPVKFNYIGIDPAADRFNFANNADLWNAGIAVENGASVYGVPEGVGQFTFVPGIKLKPDSGDGSILIELALAQPGDPHYQGNTSNDARMLKGFRSFAESSNYGDRNSQAAGENRWYTVPYFIGAERTDGVEFGNLFNLAVDFDFRGYEAGEEIAWTISGYGAPILPFDRLNPDVSTPAEHINLSTQSGSETNKLYFKFVIQGIPYTFEDWANEFRDRDNPNASYLPELDTSPQSAELLRQYDIHGRAKILQVGQEIAQNFYESNQFFGENIGYGLNRKADAIGVVYWTARCLQSYGGVTSNPQFIQEFVNSARAVQTRDRDQNLFGNQPFEPGKGVGDFADRKKDADGNVIRVGL